MARQSQPSHAPAEGSNQRVVLPKVPCEPLASLPPTSILVDCAGRTWTIPAKMADQWLRVAWTEPLDPYLIFPGFVAEEDADDFLTNAMLDGVVGADDLTMIAMEALEVASGYQWWFTLRLIAGLGASWSRLGGMLLNSGVDARTLSLGAWCSAALEMWVANIEPDKAADLLNTLLEPPEGVQSDDSMFDEFSDEQEFLAAMTTAF
jgi:hypothetical protein